jgi:phosphoribosylaminoimidazole (AIR) synthetase
MEFTKVTTIDDLIRKAEWSETVQDIKKIALAVDIEQEPKFDIKKELLTYLKKKESKYRKKLNYYKDEVRKVNKMIKHLQGGGSMDNIDSMLGGADVEEPFEQMESLDRDTSQEMSAYDELLKTRHLNK